MAEHRQKGHGKKRPRRFHHGRAEGRKAVPIIDGIVQAERRARTLADEMRSVGARYHEDIEMLEVVRHAAPFVPRIEAALQMPFGWLTYGFGGAQRTPAKPRGLGKRRAAAKRARRARRSGR